MTRTNREVQTFFSGHPSLRILLPFSSPPASSAHPQFCFSFSLLALPGTYLCCTLPQDAWRSLLPRGIFRRESSGFPDMGGIPRRLKGLLKDLLERSSPQPLPNAVPKTKQSHKLRVWKSSLKGSPYRVHIPPHIDNFWSFSPQRGSPGSGTTSPKILGSS